MSDVQKVDPAGEDGGTGNLAEKRRAPRAAARRNYRAATMTFRGWTEIAIFPNLRLVQPDVAVPLMTAHADANEPAAVVREGARDYIIIRSC